MQIEKRSITIVVSLLVRIKRRSKVCILPSSVTSVDPRKMQLGILSGDYQLVFISPESILSNRRWRDLLRQEPYASHIITLLVDETHCVKKWYVH